MEVNPRVMYLVGMETTDLHPADMPAAYEQRISAWLDWTAAQEAAFRDEDADYLRRKDA